MLKNEILSNPVVTRVLAEAGLKACNFRSRTFLADTRTLRFCYRLLSGKRLAEPIVGKDAGRAWFDLPIYTGALAYPNAFDIVRSQARASFRRLGQRILDKWYRLRDEK